MGELLARGQGVVDHALHVEQSVQVLLVVLVITAPKR